MAKDSRPRKTPGKNRAALAKSRLVTKSAPKKTAAVPKARPLAERRRRGSRAIAAERFTPRTRGVGKRRRTSAPSSLARPTKPKPKAKAAKSKGAFGRELFKKLLGGK